MPIIIDENNKIVIVVPPKNGCSTVRITFGKSIGLFDMVIIDVKLRNIVKKHANDNRYIKGYKLYFICRDIEERFVSFVNNILNKRITLNNVDSKAFTQKNWIKYLEEYRNFSSVDMSLETDINSVLEYQKHIKSKFKGPKSKLIDKHGFSQLYLMDRFLRQFPIFTYNDFNIININNLKNLLAKYYGKNYMKNSNITINKKREKKYTINRISNLTDKSQLTTDEKHKIHELYIEDINMFQKYNSDIVKKLKDKYSFLHKYQDRTINIINMNMNMNLDDSELSKLSDFNPKTYLELNPDLKNIKFCDDDNLMIHYVTHGKFEGRAYK